MQLQAPATGQPDALTPVKAVARSTFWPVSGESPRGTVDAGTAFRSDHPLVAAYPSLFSLEAWTPSDTVPLVAATPHTNGKE